MDKQKLVERLMATFVGELEEHVRALNHDLVALEKAEGEEWAELVRSVFRSVHSLKGAARSVSLRPIEAACHRSESLLGAVRDGSLPLERPLLDLLFALADALEDASERLSAKQELADAPIVTLLPRLEAASNAASASGLQKLPTRALEQAPRAPLDQAGPAASADASAPPVSGVARPANAARRDDLLRVRAERLDRLLAWSGELFVARRRAMSRRDDLALLKDQLAGVLGEWRRLDGSLEALSRRAPGALPGGALSGRALIALERTRSGLKKLAATLESLDSNTLSDHHALEQAAAPLEQEIRRIRLLPFAEACDGLERLLRDLVQSSGKQADLSIEGADVELDRAVLEALRDPLAHLVRNAVDHGIELPEVRRAHGKPRRGRVTVSAALRGDGVEVSVADDGRGLDLSAIKEQAKRSKLPVPAAERELTRLVFTPGFSTAARVTELSGRGVGLDVVRHRVESVRGSVALSFEPGSGTRFVLSLPLTLTTLRVVFLRVGTDVFALPAANVRRLVRASRDELASVEGRKVLLSAGRPVAIAHLSELLGVAHGETVRAKIPLVVVTAGERQAALVVDELVSEQDVVIKSLGQRLSGIRLLSGATLLPTGRVALILSPFEIVDRALGFGSDQAVEQAFLQERSAPRKRLLVVDDSVTTRTLEKSILEAAGYDVVTAPDGAEAFRLLEERGADLVVADVEMPRMDGFMLCEAIRRSKRFRELPVVLLTALETERDKVRGLEAGADAYLLKSAFDQRELLGTIAELL